MVEISLFLAIACSALAALFAILAFVRVRARDQRELLTRSDLEQTVRQESDRVRSDAAEQARGLREEVAQNVHGFQSTTLQAFGGLAGQIGGQVRDFGAHQKERLEAVTRAIGSLTESHARGQEALRKTIEERLDAIRLESAAKLEEMRITVDEKLQSTLEKRLGESFNIVNEQLQRVYEGLGEMQSLAAGVGDLKRVLSNVKLRGVWGEIQLGNLLEQFLAPAQYICNAQVKDGSGERVEFAIRLPGHEDRQEVLLPIDAKFPQEDFERLTLAAEKGDAAGVEEASNALEARIRSFAREIHDKYINPPRTTDIAILFLPTEGLYAEVLRRPGLSDNLQRDYHVTVAGPTNLAAILNALEMGFSTLAIQKRSSEVWELLRAIRTEFNSYGKVVDKLRNQLGTASNTVENLGTRARAMTRKLREVEALPDASAREILDLEDTDMLTEGAAGAARGGSAVIARATK